MATNEMASLEWIATVAGEATTVSTTAYRVAFSVRTARISDQARVDASAVDTRATASALTITSAANGSAADVRVSVISGNTRTHWSVVGHEALGVSSTVARVPTHAVHARLVAGAFTVGYTTRR